MTTSAFNLDAYLGRIGYVGPRAPDLATLRELHHLHPAAIAFENIDPLLRRPVAIDIASIQAKLVAGGRGGYCYEQNLLFAHALRALGFSVREHTARVLWGRPETVRTPRTHLLLSVDVEGQRCLADVGFGGNVLTAPLVLDEALPQQTPHETYRLVREGGDYTAEFQVRGEWMKLLRFDLSEQFYEDHVQCNWFASTWPDSKFVRSLIGARALPGRRYALSNNMLTVHHMNGESDKRALGAAELREALADLFGIRLDGLNGLDDALTRLTNGVA